MLALVTARTIFTPWPPHRIDGRLCLFAPISRANRWSLARALRLWGHGVGIRATSTWPCTILVRRSDWVRSLLQQAGNGSWVRIPLPKAPAQVEQGSAI